jgi:hypothetical protein
MIAATAGWAFSAPAAVLAAGLAAVNGYSKAYSP